MRLFFLVMLVATLGANLSFGSIRGTTNKACPSGNLDAINSEAQYPFCNSYIFGKFTYPSIDFEHYHKVLKHLIGPAIENIKKSSTVDFHYSLFGEVSYCSGDECEIGIIFVFGNDSRIESTVRKLQRVLENRLPSINLIARQPDTYSISGRATCEDNRIVDPFVPYWTEWKGEKDAFETELTEIKNYFEYLNSNSESKKNFFDASIINTPIVFTPRPDKFERAINDDRIFKCKLSVSYGASFDGVRYISNTYELLKHWQ
jgi:hypothetical protein